MTTIISHPGNVEGGGQNLKFRFKHYRSRCALRTRIVNHHDMEIVNALKLAIAERIGNDRFELWFRGAQLNLDGSTVRIATGTNFTLSWLRNNLRPELEAACQSVLGADAAISFCVESDEPPPRQTAKLTKATPEQVAIQTAARETPVQPTPMRNVPSSGRKQTSRRKFASLNTFIGGNNNRVAVSSADMVVENPGCVSPLFLYGSAGVGKTHLAQGIWSAYRRKSDVRRCVYLSAEQFTTYFLQALNGAGLPSFRRRYRQVDLLIIEDVQFFAGKRATITELQHTIDAVSREGGQLVLTADCSPAELGGLGPEMATRLTGGLVVRVEPPDTATREKIIQAESDRRRLSVPHEVINLIADRMPGDVRQLRGALNRLQASSIAWDRSITMELAARSLEDIFQSSVRVVRITDIEDAVCRVFDVSPSNLRSASKSRKNSHPRMLAMWLARKYTQAGLAEIGEYFGRRSHATVISAANKVNLWVEQGASVRMIDQECSVKEAIRQVERRLLG